MAADDHADVVVIGGGHNGLACAAYLARAGVDVLVLEQADQPGGALWSLDRDGYRLERGAVEHTAILTNGVLDELDLAGHGLRYATRTAAATHLFGDGTRIVIDDTVEATAASIAEVSSADARAWTELAERSAPLGGAFALASAGWIPPPEVATGFARAVAGRRSHDLVELTRLPVAELAERWFESPHLRALAVFRAAFSSLAPWSPGSAAAFLLTVTGHGRSFGRPVGGSRALTDALTASIVAAGGRVCSGTAATAVRRAGSAWHIETDDGSTTTARRAVVSAMAPRPFLLDVLETGLSSRQRRRIERVREVVDNVSQLTLAAAIDDSGRLPRLGRAELDAGTIWLLAEPAAAVRVYEAARRGQLDDRPPVLVTFPSVADPGTAPAGAATMWANSFTARQLANGPWAVAHDDVTQAVWATIDSCLPGLGDHVVHQVLTTPDDLTTRNGAENAGNHVAPIPSQTLGRRPALGFGNHRTPLDGLYLTGAGTHPGGGVSGAPGRACAAAVLDDLGLGRSRVARARRVTRQLVDGFRAARGVAHDPGAAGHTQ